jgi:hypothetical protein
MRKCRHCKEEIPKIKDCKDPFQKGGFCNVDHMAKYGLEKATVSREKEAKAKHRADLKRVRDNPRASALKAAQLLSRVSAADGNGYCKCSSCDAIQKWNEMDGGHFIAKGSSSFWMLDSRNIHPQCKPCNGFAMKHGHAAIAYTSWMIDKYGKEFIDEMLAKAKTTTKRSAQLLRDYTKAANKEISEHKKRIGC